MGGRPGERFIAELRDGGDPSRHMRVLTLMAHPDDETVGLGVQLSRMREVALLTVTDGAPRNMHDGDSYGFASAAAYAEARRRELEVALTVAGHDPRAATSLDIPDQEASLQLPDLARRVAERISSVDIVVTHPYEGGHPDHDGTAFAVHAARALVARGGRAAPDIVEATSYHNDGGRIATYAFLPAPGVAATVFELSEDDRALKRRMFDAFASQRGVLEWFPIEREMLRPAPAYRFTDPPHPGTIFYDMFDWGMRGDRWRSLAEAALGELELAEPL